MADTKNTTASTIAEVNEEAKASENHQHVSMQMGTNIGPMESLTAREVTTSDDMEIDSSAAVHTGGQTYGPEGNPEILQGTPRGVGGYNPRNGSLVHRSHGIHLQAH